MIKNIYSAPSPSNSLVEVLERNTLAFLGALHTAFLISFLVAAALGASTLGASAQDIARCEGINLWEDLQKRDAAAAALIKSQADETVYGNARLFKLEKDGVAPSYLFGTMHLTDPRVTNLTPAAADAIYATQTVAIETTDILDEAAVQAKLLSQPELSMFIDGTRLSDFMDDEQRQIVEDGLAERGMRLALVDRMKPWLISGMLALPACENERKASGSQVLDAQIAVLAQNTGKELVGLETLEEQLGAMASLPMEQHIDGLVETLQMGDQINDALETMIQLYLAGDISTIWPVLRHLALEMSGEEVQPDENHRRFEEVLIDARNKTMFDRSLALLEQGGAFIAVGALHLPGELGLAKLFAEAGFKITAIE
ncbi:MAG: TraB/GumN family protein [Pseudomonadota bacterium]